MIAVLKPNTTEEQKNSLISWLEQKNLERTEHDLEWFTLKFDYRNQDKPWGNSKDAVERTINKLKGRAIDAERE